MTDRLDNLEDRVTELENICKGINSDIASLKSIVSGLENGDYIQSVTPIVEGGVEVGYTIVFAKQGTVVIRHGKDGRDGADGKDGEDGKDGADGKDGVDVGTTPDIGIRQDEDGNWYWTLNGEWLLDDNGQKVKAVGSDGKDGHPGEPSQPGADGITPLLKIENDYWHISYDNGATWTVLGKAKGEDGEPGVPGEPGTPGASSGSSIFSDVTWDSENVYFKLNDGTVITVPKTAGTGLAIEFSVEQGVAIVPDATLEISYTVRGGDDKTLVRVINTDYCIYAFVKPLSPTSGKIYASLDDWYDEDELDEPYYDGKYGDEVTNRDIFNSNLVLIVSVSDGKGNSITKALNFTEGKISSVSDAYVSNAPAGSVKVTINTNVEYTVSVPADAASWLQYVPTKADMRSDILTFNLKENASKKFRSAEVRLVNNLDETLESFTVIQRSSNADEVVTFADSKVEEVCLARFDANKDGKLTYEEISTVTDVSDLFKYQTTITSFDEFEYFTSVSKIPSQFFSGCKYLESVKLPESVRQIGSDAFSDCISLKSIVIPEGVTNEDDYYDEPYAGSWFAGCISLESVVLPSTLVYLPSSCFEGCTSLKSVNIPAGITEIPYHCFSGCSAITSLDLAKIEKFGSYALSGTGITSVAIPQIMTEIPEGLFSGCKNLTSVKLHSGVTSISNYAFASTGIKNVDLSGITSLGAGAFSMSGLTSVVIPEAVTSIPVNCFRGCEDLASVTLHNKLTYIEEYAFGSYTEYDYENYDYSTTYYCSSLTDIDLPESLLAIGRYAFERSALKGKKIEGTDTYALVIPESVTQIDDGAFSDCKDLKAVKMMSKIVPDFGYDVFERSTAVYVPSVSVDAYKDALYNNTVLAYEMMTFSLRLECYESTVTFDNDYRRLKATLNVKVLGDLAGIENVEEYGIYIDRYDGRYTEWCPIESLNEQTVLELYIDSDWYTYDYENYVAKAEVTVGAYLEFEDLTRIRYNSRKMELVYDEKPSVTFKDAKITSTDSYCANFEVKCEQKGKLWVELDWMYEGGYFSLRPEDNSTNLYTGSVDMYAPGHAVAYYAWRDGDYNEFTSNFLHVERDENDNFTIEITDTRPVIP